MPITPSTEPTASTSQQYRLATVRDRPLRPIQGWPSADLTAHPSRGDIIECVHLTERLRRRIHNDFPNRGEAEEVVRLVGQAHESERVQAAIVLLAAGDTTMLHDSLMMAQEDWRDVLMGAELADDNWPTKLDQLLGPPGRRHH